MQGVGKSNHLKFIVDHWFGVMMFIAGQNFMGCDVSHPKNIQDAI